MFYCGGDYSARKGSGIGQGSISLHPGGHSHGPQPGAYERSIGVQAVDELAVMVDTFRPLDLGEGGLATDDGRYAWTWAQGGRNRRAACCTGHSWTTPRSSHPATRPWARPCPPTGRTGRAPGRSTSAPSWYPRPAWPNCAASWPVRRVSPTP